ncbi:MAG: DUF2975 domain-containing protein [Bacteroidia bacterium]|nr:DUF2975 domain-containing protein [Bacteroidia bacterium]
MEIKHYRLISNLTSFLFGVFIFHDVLNYFFLFKDADYSVNFLIPQGIYVLGLICLIVCFAIILETIKKKGVFIRRNERIFRYFGLVITALGFASDLLFNFLIDERTAQARMLGFIGGTLLFVSFIFKIGIKMQEEQDLTI